MSLDQQHIEMNASNLVLPVLTNIGYQLVACEFVQESGRWILRFYIDKEGGVTVGDCSRVSHAIEDLIAAEDVVPVRYDLEVSSPGVYRPLTRREDYERFLGERVRVRTLHPVDGRSHFAGVLAGLEGDEVVILIDGERYRVPLTAIRRAKLDPEDVFSQSKEQ